MMSRTQISLDAEMLRRARDRARKHGVSLAEYVRRLVTRDLQKPGAPADPSALFDLGSSGGSDVAADKDGMVGEAVAAGARRRRRA